jgi:hypothetical protein
MKKAPPEVLELDDVTPEGVRAAYVVRFGPECAAWLCNRFRSRLRRHGEASVHIPFDQEEPPWFSIAISYLEKHRSSSWSVRRWGSRGVRRWTIRWLGKRRIPDSIAVGTLLS